MLSTRSRPSTSAPTDGSRTITVHDTQPRPEGSGDDRQEPLIPERALRLRGGPRSGPRVAWDETVVDNENCGKKKSKICCIYHRPKEFDESSDEESSSDEDSAPSDDGRARPRHDPRRHPHHFHPHREGDARSGGANGVGGRNGLRETEDGGGTVCRLEESREANVYEIQPHKKGKGRMDGKSFIHPVLVRNYR